PPWARRADGPRNPVVPTGGSPRQTRSQLRTLPPPPSPVPPASAEAAIGDDAPHQDRGGPLEKHSRSSVGSSEQAIQRGSAMRLWILLGACILLTVGVVGSAASAAPPGAGTCSGGAIAAGTYNGFTVTGNC